MLSISDLTPRETISMETFIQAHYRLRTVLRIWPACITEEVVYAPSNILSSQHFSPGSSSLSSGSVVKRQRCVVTAEGVHHSSIELCSFSCSLKWSSS